MIAEQQPVTFLDRVTNVSDFIWAGLWNGEEVLPFPPMVIILFGIGMWIMVGLRFYPIVNLFSAFAGLFNYYFILQRLQRIDKVVAIFTAN